MKMTKRELILDYEKLCDKKMNGARLGCMNFLNAKTDTKQAVFSILFQTVYLIGSGVMSFE